MNAVGRLASAIGYPQEVPGDSVDFAFKVDGGEIRALDLEKRLVLLREISREEDELPRLASYSVGRALREDAILYWDERIGAAVLSHPSPLSCDNTNCRQSSRQNSVGFWRCMWIGSSTLTAR